MKARTSFSVFWFSAQQPSASQLTSTGPPPRTFTALCLIITTHSVVEGLSGSLCGKDFLAASLFYPKGTVLRAVLNWLFFFPAGEVISITISAISACCGV